MSEDKKETITPSDAVEVTFKDKPVTKLQLSSLYGSFDNNRATGRTFRMLLRAALALSENKTGHIVITAKKHFYANDLKKQLIHLMSVSLSEEYIKSIIPRILTSSYKDYNSDSSKFGQCLTFHDHYHGGN